MNDCFEVLNEMTDERMNSFLEYRNVEDILRQIKAYYYGTNEGKILEKLSVSDFADYLKDRFNLSISEKKVFTISKL